MDFQWSGVEEEVLCQVNINGHVTMCYVAFQGYLLEMQLDQVFKLQVSWAGLFYWQINRK